MAEKRLRTAGEPRLSPDQRAVFDAYFDEDAVVCTPAGSGTGKTTTAIEVVAEAVVRELHRAPETNPFESILVTTFTTDAARQLTTELVDRLREHRRVAPDHDPVVAHWADLRRWVATASHVRTIDAFIQDLLREIALDAGIAPSFRVADGIRRSDLLADVFERLHADESLAGPIDRLAAAFPPDGEDWRSVVVALHRRCRECCLSVAQVRRELRQSVTEVHAGRQPETFEDVLGICRELTDFDPVYVREGLDDHEAWAAHARQTYDASRQLAEDLGDVLDAFAQRYDEVSRSSATFTHTDITAILQEFLADDPAGRPAEDRPPVVQPARTARGVWVRERLADRFNHVVVDEFQDTNVAQCRILAHLLPDANALLIGDCKQSIYEWRSAEPRLFADLIADASGTGEGNVLDIERLVLVPLGENFRSHPHLVATANHLFTRIFADPGRGGIGTFDIEYDHLTAERPATEDDDPHVHILKLDDPEPEDDQTRRAALVDIEAERVAGTLRTVFAEGTLSVDRNLATIGDPLATAGEGTPEDCLDTVRPGDVAVLFRSKTAMRRYSRVLDRYGIDNAVIGRHTLFKEPEIQALIDALAWIDSPGSQQLEPVVTSGVAAIGPTAREALAGAGYDLDGALAGPDLHPAARDDLEALAALRDALRSERSRPKGRLVTRLLAHSAFDVVALADAEGLQRYANIRRFVGVIDEWEDEETLSYGEFVRRLRRLRDGRVADDHPLPPVVEMDSPETVKLLTVHAAKGREFPVVVLADTAYNEAYQKACDEPFVADRHHGIALRPWTGGSVQPDAGSIPTFAGGWFHDDDTGYAFDRGVLWLSERRAADGRIRPGHPLTDHVRDARAEFWRVLYVAVTRACDHLIVPLGTTRGTVAEYNTWAGAIAEYLDPGEDGVIAADDGPGVPVGVDDLPVADPLGEPTQGLADLLSKPSETDADGIDPTAPGCSAMSVVPRNLAATGIPDLFEDPGVIQHTDHRGQATSPEPTPGEPGNVPILAADREAIPVDRSGLAHPDPNPEPLPVDVPATVWGSAVHAALEALHRASDPDMDLDRELDRVLAPYPRTSALRSTLQASVIPAYRASETWAAVAGADERYPEIALVAPLPTVGSDGHRQTYVRGRIDLLYYDDGWRIADFKTGPIPAPGDEGLAAYRTQLSTYAWLLRTVYGIDVDEARLTAVHPPLEEVSLSVDPDGFGDRLAGTIDALDGAVVATWWK